MGQIYRFLGLTVGLVVPEIDSFDDKRAAYEADITYGTNTEFGFDYLRDNMAPSRAEMVQRGHHFAIVDEVDSILIDEARTPLIISGPVRRRDEALLPVRRASPGRSCRDADYEVDEEKNLVVPTEEGIAKVERQLGVENLYDAVAVNYVHQLGKALEAKELYHRDKDYIVADGEVKIVDEFTGRVLEGRRWSDGLHQAVEAKERVRIKDENHTWATVTLQNYFRMYDKLAGHDRHRRDRGGRVRLDLRARGGAHPDERADDPGGPPRPHLQDRGRQVPRRGRGPRRALRDRPAGPRRHGLGRASEHLSRLLDKQGIPH